jgi:hypothetical protein
VQRSLNYGPTSQNLMRLWRWFRSACTKCICRYSFVRTRRGAANEQSFVPNTHRTSRESEAVRPRSRRARSAGLTGSCGRYDASSKRRMSVAVAMDRCRWRAQISRSGALDFKGVARNPFDRLHERDHGAGFQRRHTLFGRGPAANTLGLGGSWEGQERSP